MSKFNRQLLSLYTDAQHTSVSEFSEQSFLLLKGYIDFETGGFCEFAPSRATGIELTSASPYNICVKEKLNARRNYIGEEVIGSANKTIASDDLALQEAFKSNGAPVAFTIEKGMRSNLFAYAKKTGSIQTLTAVNTTQSSLGFQTFSIWRSKAKDSFENDDIEIGKLLLPHIFQAISINRRIQTNNIGMPNYYRAICSLSGIFHFIDTQTIELMRLEFNDWSPPYLPKSVLSSILSNSEKTFIGRNLTVHVTKIEDLLYLKIQRTVHFDKLTRTETAIAEMLAKSESYKAIAQKLGTQPSTVRNQAHSIYMKLGISSKSSLAKLFNLYRS